MNYRAAQRRQHVTATSQQLTIEDVSPAGRSEATSLPTAWVQVELTPKDEPEVRDRSRQKVIVRSHGRTAEIGGFLHPAETPRLAREVNRMVDRARRAALTEDEPGLPDRPMAAPITFPTGRQGQHGYPDPFHDCDRPPRIGRP